MDDRVLKGWWRDLVVMLSCRYDASVGEFGRHFVEDLNKELPGMRDRWWNYERFIILQMMILQQSCHVIVSHIIQRRFKKLLDALEAGCHGI